MAETLAPGAVIGIIGGGQLGRMTALAAAPLGFRCHIYTPEENSPAAQVAERTTVAPYDDETALAEFAASVDVITYEFENIPVDTVQRLSKLAPVRPRPSVLAVSQHRVAEKDFARDSGAGTAPYRHVTTLDQLRDAVAEIGRPSVLKTCRFGYDGKGQVKITDRTELEEAWNSLDTDDAVLEGFVSFEMEISVIVARGLDGTSRAFPVAENHHVDHILSTSTVPAAIPAETEAAARTVAEALAERLDLVGLLAVEMFVTPDGKVLVNEVAPRPHNSGHWSQDGCATSQFEQFVRAVTGLPLGPVDVLFPTVMHNLIGDEVEQWEEIVAEPDAKLHLYGKAEARPGRKMGHVNMMKRA
ncbi:5-(carboxyamino)imidazole ribonucleotide synthase [Nisaea acidiphila]|uniref:N5-carboxyaminoimidazole ribonucleotide synthase n=1 Tax=Nisaea acidiphila TaxID=1862145 RepID=A0A9J7AV63_9PROT|nr:5-(carboxyamino)imidazole ribonucleotide synthase [Nisaea acidiphila]UUX50998.1 5-(carboxyamino)imidazole ribonucleotide synthase [Nisaea acidiphila]